MNVHSYIFLWQAPNEASAPDEAEPDDAGPSASETQETESETPQLTQEVSLICCLFLSDAH